MNWAISQLLIVFYGFQSAPLQCGVDRFSKHLGSVNDCFGNLILSDPLGSHAFRWMIPRIEPDNGKVLILLGDAVRFLFLVNYFHSYQSYRRHMILHTGFYKYMWIIHSVSCYNNVGRHQSIWTWSTSSPFILGNTLFLFQVRIVSSSIKKWKFISIDRVRKPTRESELHLHFCLWLLWTYLHPFQLTRLDVVWIMRMGNYW